MHPELAHFIGQMLRVVLATLMPVALLAFLSMPLSLGGHPGEPRQTETTSERHMT